MIVASLVVASCIGSMVGRLYSFVAMLLVSPLIAAAAAMTSWKGGDGLARVALVGLGAMVVSQIGFLLGVMLDPRFGKQRRSFSTRSGRKPARSHPPSAAEH